MINVLPVNENQAERSVYVVWCNKPHRVATGLHIAQLFSQNAAGLPLTPVCRSVERRPAIKVHSWHIHPTLTQYPRQQQGDNSRTAWDIVRHSEDESNI